MLTRDLTAAGLHAEAAKAVTGGQAPDLGVTATGSSSQADSYALRSGITTVTAGGANTGVRLPANAETGDEFWVLNDKGSTLFVYPPVGGSINGGTGNAKVDLSNDTSMVFKALPGGNYLAV